MNTQIAFIESLGISEIYIILGIAILIVWPFWRIFKKAGYHGALGLLMVIPLLNLVMILFLAFADWPSHKNGPQVKQ